MHTEHLTHHITLNADRTQRCVVHSPSLNWMDSPSSGVFSDEHGDYPAGSWLRSPHMSQHQPFSREGCLILVKTGHLV